MDVPVEGIDQIRSREDFAGALNQFRDRHAAKHQQPALSYSKIGEKAGYQGSSIHNYLKAKTLPQRREIVEDILAVFDASPAEVEAMLRAYDRLKDAPRLAARETKGAPPQPRHTRRSLLLGGLRVVTAGAVIALTSTATLAGWSEKRRSPEQSEARLPTCADVGVFADGIDAYRWNREVWTDAHEAAGGRAVLGCPVRTADGFVHWWGRGMSQDLQDRRGKQTRLMALDRDHVIVMSGQYWTDYTNLHTRHAADLQGYPITDPVSCGNAKVVLLDKGDYTPGAMVTSPSGTFIWLPRPVWQEYQAMGGPEGPLGRPLNALDSTIRGTIAFEHGSIDMLDNVTARVRSNASRTTTMTPCPS